MCVIYDIKCGIILFGEIKKRHSKNKSIKFVNSYPPSNNFQTLIKQLLSFIKLTQKHDFIVCQDCIFNKRFHNKEDEKLFLKLISFLKKNIRINTYIGDLNINKIENFIFPFDDNDFVIEF